MPQFRFPEDVEGYSSEAECRYLYDLACAIPEPVANIVELGTYKGRTAIALAQSGHIVYAVDRFQPETGGFFDGFPDHHAGRFSENVVLEHARRYGVSHLIRVISGDTVAVGERVRNDPHPPVIDLLFIDANHEYEGVSADFAAWAPMVAPDGVIVFDDVLWPGVQRFLAELKDWDPVAGPQAGGMMAMRRSPAEVMANV